MVSLVDSQKYLFDRKGDLTELDSLVCKTIIHPQSYTDQSKDNYMCTTYVQPQFYEGSEDEYNKFRRVSESESVSRLSMGDANRYYVTSPHGVDPGVLAVSNALFTSSGNFQCIPIPHSPKVFRRRRKGEPNSEWSNAFVTRVDPYECTQPEQEYKPYEMTKIYDENGVKTVFNFDTESYHQENMI